MQFVESRSLNVSMLLHFLLAVVAFVGLPAILPDTPDPTPLVMTVEILPITGVTNVKPSEQPIQKEQNAAKPPKPVEKPMVEPLKPPPPKPVEKAFDPTEGAEPAPKEKEKPKENPKSEFDKIMEQLKNEKPITTEKPKPAPAPTKPGTDKTTTEENKTKSDAPYDPTKPLSLSETDAIKGQIIPNWSPPLGLKDAATLVVRVKVELMQDGTVQKAELASDQASRYASDTSFRAAADAAIRAVWKTKQLKNLPTDKYGTWKEMEISFDPKDLL